MYHGVSQMKVVSRAKRARVLHRPPHVSASAWMSTNTIEADQ